MLFQTFAVQTSKGHFIKVPLDASQNYILYVNIFKHISGNPIRGCLKFLGKTASVV